jgi:hypothetical protein
LKPFFPIRSRITRLKPDAKENVVSPAENSDAPIVQFAPGFPVDASFHVEVFYPAMRLYQRLGFSKVGENDVYWLMEWQPGRQSLQNRSAQKTSP